MIRRETGSELDFETDVLVWLWPPGQARRYLIVPIFASSCRIC